MRRSVRSEGHRFVVVLSRRSVRTVAAQIMQVRRVSVTYRHFGDAAGMSERITAERDV
jgi:hypothetical protein